jgi:hypothetical protein
MIPPRQQAELRRIRANRCPARPDLSLRAAMAEQSQRLRRMEKSLGPLAAALAEAFPPGVCERLAVAGLSRGVLTIRAADAGALHEAARLLRSGAEATLIRRSPWPVRRVKAVL